MKNNYYKNILLEMFNQAVLVSHPSNIMKNYIPDIEPSGKVIVVGAGKGSAEMARSFEEAWYNKGYKDLSGLVITRYGHKKKCKNINIKKKLFLPSFISFTNFIIFFIRVIRLFSSSLIR